MKSRLWYLNAAVAVLQNPMTTKMVTLISVRPIFAVAVVAAEMSLPLKLAGPEKLHKCNCSIFLHATV